MRLLLGNSVMLRFSILFLSGPGKAGLAEGARSSASFITRGGGALWSFAALNGWFPLSQEIVRS